MDVSDFDAMAAAMAQSLAGSEALAERDPDSVPWVITVDKVTNLTSDVMTQAEQWAVMQRIAGALPVRALRDTKNVSLVLPRGRSDSVIADGDHELPGAMRWTPTHVLHATFMSLTRAEEGEDAKRRVEAYYCEFELLHVAGGEPMWTDRFEYKREARGAIWD